MLTILHSGNAGVGNKFDETKQKGAVWVIFPQGLLDI